MKDGKQPKKNSFTSLDDHDKKFIQELRAKGCSIDKISGFFPCKSNRTAIYLYLKSLPGYKPLNRKRGAIV